MSSTEAPKTGKPSCGCRCNKPADPSTEALRDYPGAAIDAADGERVTPQAEKERTKVLGENPRDNDLDQ